MDTGMEPPGARLLDRLTTRLEHHLSSLRQVCFKLEVMKAVLATGKQEWLDDSAAELKTTLGDLHRSDEAFRSALADAAAGLGLSSESTLREIAGASPEPWGFVLVQHRGDVLAAFERAKELQSTIVQLLQRGQASVAAALALLGGDPPTGYGETGDLDRVRGSLGLLDARA
jgi:hypothetical protein